jgi:hypothetical protein
VTSNTARVINLLLGAWLLVSAFVWHHTPAEYTNTLIVGGLIVLVALLALAYRPLRYANLILAFWLFLSALLVTQSAATAWNNGLVAVAVFLLSLVTGRELRRYVPQQPHAPTT